jgi:hypothetical protein
MQIINSVNHIQTLLQKFCAYMSALKRLPCINKTQAHKSTHISTHIHTHARAHIHTHTHTHLFQVNELLLFLLMVQCVRVAHVTEGLLALKGREHNLIFTAAVCPVCMCLRAHACVFECPCVRVIVCVFACAYTFALVHVNSRMCDWVLHIKHTSNMPCICMQ